MKMYNQSLQIWSYGWIREVNQNFVEPVMGSDAKNLIHDVPFFVKLSYTIHVMDYVKS